MEAKEKILTSLVKLDTPDKAAVQVVILADPVSKDFSDINLLLHFPHIFKYFDVAFFSDKRPFVL